MTAHRFPYVQVDPALGVASALPYMPMTSIRGQRQIAASALVDSDAALNGLPYDLGVQLGAVWDQQSVPVALSGNMAASEARALLLTGQVADFDPVRLAFAWSRSNNVPVILGQINSFMEFDICFLRAQLLFEIRRVGNAED